MVKDGVSSSCLFPQQYLPGGAEVLSGLRGALVLPGLQPNDALAGPQLRFGPLASILLRRSRSQRRAPPLLVLVRLKPKIPFHRRVPVRSHPGIPYRSADGEYGHGHSVDVLLLEQVDGLEQVNVRHSVLDASLLESRNRRVGYNGYRSLL